MMSDSILGMGAMKPHLHYWTLYEDSEPWAVFANGHVDPSQFTRDDIAAAMRRDHCDADDAYIVQYLPAVVTFEHRWMTQWSTEEDLLGEDLGEPREDWPWNWCAATDRGAEAVTAHVWSR